MGSYEPLASMEPFREVLRDPDAIARQWKARGGKVVGCRCIFVPEEIVQAAGMLPYPLYGTAEPVRLADSYFQPCTCEFVRNLFDSAMGGRYSFLDGLVFANTCDAVRRLWDMWEAYVDGAPTYMINNPQKLRSEVNRDYYLEELRRFRTWVELISGRPITDEALGESIELFNRTRGLLGEVASLRKQDPPLITGSEALEAGMAVTLMPRDRAGGLLARLLEEAGSRKVEEAYGPRILVTGSILDDPALVTMIEEEGGLVVADDLCTSAKAYWHLVGAEGDPMTRLYEHLNRRPLCACMHPMEARFEYLDDLVREYDVEAVIDYNLKYCHPFLYEAPLLRKHFEALDVPVNVLEIGHDMSGHGQLRTRVQAFLEMLET